MSVPDGAPAVNTKNYSRKFDYLDTDALKDVKRFILATDVDEPGRKLEEELARRLGKERCLRVVWPTGVKDANELLVKYGVEWVKAVVGNPAPYPIEGLYSLVDFEDKLDDIFFNGPKLGVNPGWEFFGQHYTVKPGEMTIVTGIPSHGKSEFIDSVMINLAKTHGWRFGVFSPENQPIEQHAQKMVEKILKQRMYKGHLIPKKDYIKAKGVIFKTFEFILPKSCSVQDILDMAKIAVQRRGINGLVLDPWNEMDHNRASGMTETEHISQSLTKIRTFARDNGVHVWLIAHPKKLDKHKETGEYPVPTPWDISGSANWRNKADCCLTVFRDVMDDLGRVDIHIQKVRNRWVGKLGRVTMRYNINTSEYIEWAEDNQ